MRVTEFQIDLPSGRSGRNGTFWQGRQRAIAGEIRINALLPPASGAPASILLRQVCARAVKMLGDAPRTRIAVSISDEIRLSPRNGRRVALIASELIDNAIVHAHPAGTFGAIEVACARDADHVILEVRDDGVGLPEGFDPRTDSGAGLRLVRTVAEALGASVRFSSGGCGVSVEVRVPAA